VIPIICLKHQIVFRIRSTLEEQRSNQYQNGKEKMVLHLIQYTGKGCKLVPVDFQKARDYDGN